MLKALITIAKLAAAANIRISVILFVVELLIQLDKSVVKSQADSKQRCKSGFVYVLRDRANGERFKLGHRAVLPSRDRQFLSSFEGSVDFILIVPARNAPVLEKRLRRAYATGSRKKDWFLLKNWEQREIMIIATLVKVVSLDDLGMSEVNEEIVQLAGDLLKQLLKLVNVFGKKRGYAHGKSDRKEDASVAETDSDQFTAIASLQLNWESVLDENYRKLPKATGKSVYICIIRDNDAKRAKIYFHNHPVKAIEAAFTERSLQFPLEVVLVLKADNYRKARNTLLSPLERKHGTQWIELSDEELRGLKQSALQSRSHGSVYVSPASHWGLETMPTDTLNQLQELPSPAGYVCVVQGVKCGKSRKIWRTSHPKRLAGARWRTRKLNNPHDAITAKHPIRFTCIIKSDYVKSFQAFLHKRYRAQRKHKTWFKLDDAQLTEMNRLGSRKKL